MDAFRLYLRQRERRNAAFERAAGRGLDAVYDELQLAERETLQELAALLEADRQLMAVALTLLPATSAARR